MSESVNIRELNELVASKSDFTTLVTRGMDQTIVGQKHLVESLLVALLANGQDIGHKDSGPADRR